ncbi:MAG TPA: hypothetical protein VFG68_17905 [Fimbriiglobus sp.]|nr:hypothetical protein [Fimbriiglobus sp.]
MDVVQASSSKTAPVADAPHHRELLRRWLRLSREVLTPEELVQLFDDTRRALDAEPIMPGFDRRHGPGED